MRAFVSYASSLQEVAPLSYSFIGGYFLTPYIARFEDALNQAAEKFLSQDEIGDPASPTDGASAVSGRQEHAEDEEDEAAQPLIQTASSAPPTRPPLVSRTASLSTLLRTRIGKKQGPYTLVRARNVGMTALLFFARDPSRLDEWGIQIAEVGFGAASMGNKGAVGLRVVYNAPPPNTTSNGHEEGAGSAGARSTELTFVATHLTSMEWNLKRRNGNWRSIVSGLMFADPRSIIPPEVAGELSPPAPAPPSEHVIPADASDVEDSRDARSWDGRDDGPVQLTKAQRQALQQVSLFRPSTHVFLAGDLNYRISTRKPPALAPFPSLDRGSKHHYEAFLPRDQLTAERAAGRAMHGLAEAEVTFPPTYKYMVERRRPEVVGSGAGGGAGEGLLGIRLRSPSEEELGQEDEDPLHPNIKWRFAPHRWPGWTDRVLYTPAPGLRVTAYEALPVQRSSDHRPVFWRATVPVLGPEEMKAQLPALEDANLKAIFSTTSDVAPGLQPSATQPLLTGVAVPVDDDGTAASSERQRTAGSDDGDVGEEQLAAARKIMQAVSGRAATPDPRIHGLPFPVDLDAFTHRAAARRKEVLVGWGTFLWATREGAAVLATVGVVVVGGWFVWGMFTGGVGA